MLNELYVNGINLTNPKDIADGFNVFFSNIGPDLRNKIGTSDCNFQEYINTAKSKFFAFVAITVNSVCHLLRGVSSFKTTGIDKIFSKILKIASLAISSSQHIFLIKLLLYGLFLKNGK